MTYTVNLLIKFIQPKLKDIRFNEVWCTELMDMAEYKKSNNNGLNDMFAFIDNFFNSTWWDSLEKKYDQTLTDEILNILTTSERTAIEMKNDRGKQFIKDEFQKIWKLKNS